ncbi:MAG: glycosyltransferase family A protein [Pseudomonadota bacterium]
MVLIPAFNSALHLETTLRSLQEQTHSFWTAVIIDDGSTDRTAELVETFSERDVRLRLLRLPDNSGRPSVPRNRGLEHAIASGIPFDFVAFLDADDYWLPDKLKIDLQYFEQHPSVELLCNNGVLILNNDLITKLRLKRIRSLTPFLVFHDIYCSSVILRKSVVLKHLPLFDEDPRLKAVEDTELWYRLLADHVLFDAVPSYQTVYRINDASISHVDLGQQIRRIVRLYATASRKNKRVPRLFFYVPAFEKVCRFVVKDLVFRLASISPFAGGAYRRKSPF